MTELNRRLDASPNDSADDVAVLADCQSRLAALKASLSELRPSGSLAAGKTTPVQSRYLIVQDECLQMTTWLDELSIAIRMAAKSGSATETQPHSARAAKVGWDKSRWKPRSRGSAARAFDADDEIEEFLSEGHLPTLTRDVDVRRELPQATRRLTWLERLAAADESRLAEEVTVRLKLLDRLRTEVLDRFVAGYLAAWSDDVGLESRRSAALETDETERVLVVSGLLAQEFVAGELGYHLLRSSPQSPPRLLQVSDGLPTVELIRDYDEADGELGKLRIEMLRDAAFERLSNPKR